jgi:CRP/FNR family transcriptional regulator
MNKHDDAFWLERFPQLMRLDQVARGSLQQHLRFVEIPSNQAVYHVGDRCQNFLLVLSGSVRVQMFSRSGHEIVLYRVNEGQSCILTTASLLADEIYLAEAITETPVQAALLPAADFGQLMSGSAAFRHFVFSNFGQRIADLLSLINTVAFERMDVRLARFLLQRLGQRRVIDITHQDIANELGTAREVVSRLLKDFERRALIGLHRGSVEVEDMERLKQIAEL